MRFHLYQQADGLLVVVPHALAPPSAAACGELTRLGPVDVDLTRFSSELVTRLGIHGHATAHGADADLMRERLASSTATS